MRQQRSEQSTFVKLDGKAGYEILHVTVLGNQKSFVMAAAVDNTVLSDLNSAVAMGSVMRSQR